MPGSVLHIVNPAGHGGTGLATWESFEALWPDRIDQEDVVVTERPGQAREIAAFPGDHTTLAAVGGDGTVADVISGVLDRRGARPKVAIVPGGTGNDIARAAGVESVGEAVDALRGGEDRGFDVVRVDYWEGGEETHRYAFLKESRASRPSP